MLVVVDIFVGENVMMIYWSIVNIYELVVFDVFWYFGFNVIYIWDFGDGSIECIYLNLIIYRYILFGIFYIKFIVVNFVNKIVLYLVIVVFDFIKGFRFLNLIEVKVFGLLSEIKWEVVEGINIIYVVDFGDGSFWYEKVIILDESCNCFIIYLYFVVGNYIVFVFVFNLVGLNIFIIF